MTAKLTLKGADHRASSIKIRCALSGFILLMLVSISAASAWQSRILVAEKEYSATQSSQKRAGSIRGRVVDEAGQPLANVVVYVSPVGGTYEEMREVATDDDGNFEVTGLSARAYVVEADVAGYVEDYDGESSAHHLTGDFVTLRFRKGGVTTGAVTNSSGEPVVKARVVAVRVRNSEGHRLRSPQEWDDVETDDRGIYRIYGLESGSYLVKVKQIGEYEDEHLRNEAPIYHPSATHDDAQEVKVNKGEEVSGINISYRSEPGYIISGRCSGATRTGSSDETYLKLIHAKSGVVLYGGWEGYKQNRAFAFYGVPDGDYYLIAQEAYDKPAAASLPRRVTVKGSDVTGIELKLMQLGSIAGRVVIETSLKSGLQPDCKAARETSVEEIVIQALHNDKAIKKDLPVSFFDSVISNIPDEKGDFILRNLAPEPYYLDIELINEDLYVRALTARMPGRQSSGAARDGFAIQSGERVTGVTFTIAKGAAGIRGRVVASSETARLPARLRVHLVPSEREHADMAVRFFETDMRSDGTFALTNIAPGRYWLLVRSTADDETAEANWQAAWTAAGRAALRREAEAAKIAIDLQPCQRVTDHMIRYMPLPSATKPALGKTEK